MTRNYSVPGSCIAACSLLLLSVQVMAAEELPRRSGRVMMPHPVLGAVAPQQEKFSSSFDISGAQHATFNFTVGAPGKIAVSIQSQGDPVTGSLLTPGGVNVPLDGASSREYMASADDIKKGAQWKVEVSLAAPQSARRNAVLSSSGHASGDITILHPAGGGNGRQPIHEIPQNANSGSARSAAIHVTDQPLTRAPAALAQTVAARRKDEFSSDGAGNTNQTPYEPAPPDSNPPYESAPPDTNPPYESTPPSANPPYESAPPSANPPYESAPPNANLPYEPTPQDLNQSQYPQQPDSTAVQSPLQQQSPQYQQPNYQGQQYQAQQYQGQQYQGQQYQGPQPGMQQQNQVQPAYSPGTGVQGGSCTVKLSVDRSTINLVDANTGSERKHLSLGQDRVQKIFSSPDNAWSVAVYKIRGAQQYGFIALDLAKCEDQLPSDLTAVPSEARFDQAEVVLTIDSKEKRFPLRNSRMQ